MAAIIDKDDAPRHLFNVPELDFSADLFSVRLAAGWFSLGARSIGSRRDERRVEDEVCRQTILLPHGSFATIFGKLKSVGNVLTGLGKPSGLMRQESGGRAYSYAPFHRFEFMFDRAVGEPLIFVHFDTSGAQLFINPDLWLHFELEERAPGHGIWWDPRRGVDVLVRRMLDRSNMETVEIQADYLLKYLQARQMSLLVAHYRQLLLFDPSQSAIKTFVKEDDVTLGSPDQGAKAILQNWGFRKNAGRIPFLQRRLHLWFEIKPPELGVGDPWVEQPSFDPYTFTMPTSAGPVAPARWKNIRGSVKHTFEGEACDFMNRVYFRQEVLAKYEGAFGFDVKDDGSVSCRQYWGLDRSTARLGNELLSTAIGDFAEGVPFEEWPHWKQYAVEPPSPDTVRSLVQEQPVPEAVNELVRALQELNAAFADIAASFGATNPIDLWRGSLDGLAGRCLKWVYPAAADDGEFLKRATLASTLFLDGLQTLPIRNLLRSVGKNLHESFEKPPQSLGSRKLLQRATLTALLIVGLQPRRAKLSLLLKQAEGSAKSAASPDLQRELDMVNGQVRNEFAPLAFLYDLRTYGGLAHPPNKEKAAAAATSLGLPKEGWHRTHYLYLLKVIAESVRRISEHFEVAAQVGRP
jgi:hypothetical protein